LRSSIAGGIASKGRKGHKAGGACNHLVGDSKGEGREGAGAGGSRTRTSTRRDGGPTRSRSTRIVPPGPALSHLRFFLGISGTAGCLHTATKPAPIIKKERGARRGRDTISADHIFLRDELMDQVEYFCRADGPGTVRSRGRGVESG
jgi:hypothetical protein